jgi:hypothetical protein
LAAHHIQNADWNWNDLNPNEGEASIGDMVGLIGFCYPSALADIADGERPIYVGPSAIDDPSPLFINEGRSNSGIQFTWRSRTARPSSGHPGVVVAAFCDQSTRVLKDDMDKDLFVRLCRPGSGVILNPKDLD